MLIFKDMKKTDLLYLCKNNRSFQIYISHWYKVLLNVSKRKIFLCNNMKIHRPFNVCSLAYFLWYGLLCFMVLCRTSPHRIIQLLFIPVSTSGEYLYKSFMLRESRREESYYNVSKLAAIENDWKLYTIVLRWGVTYRIYVRSKCWMTIETRRLYPLIWFSWDSPLARCFQ